MPFPELYFNVDNGYLEGLVRGFKAGILSQADYLNLVQCETLEGPPELIPKINCVYNHRDEGEVRDRYRCTIKLTERIAYTGAAVSLFLQNISGV